MPLLPSRSPFGSSLLAIGCLWALLMGSAGAADVESRFDFGRGHTFLGFGAQVWVSSRDPAPGLQLLRDANARYVRVSLVPKFTLSQLKEGLTVQEALRHLQASDSAEQRQRFTAFRDQIRKANLTMQLIFWRMPDPWVSTQNKQAGTRSKARFAKLEFIDEYVNVIVAQLLYLRELGIEPEAVELVNEPHGAWGTKFNRENYASLVVLARETMNRHGLQRIKIAGPGVNLRQFDTYIGALVERKAAGDLGYISAHVYEPLEALADVRGTGVGSFLGRGRFGPIMITEYGNRKPSGADDDADDGDISSPAYAVVSAAKSVRLLAHGASGLLFWQLQEFNWNKRSHGMISQAGVRHPVARAMVALFGSVPHDARAVGPTQPVRALHTVALQSADRSFLMVVNDGDRALTWQASLAGGHAKCNKLVAVHAYQAGGGTGAGAGLDQVSVERCQLKAAIPAGTVATIVLE